MFDRIIYILVALVLYNSAGVFDLGAECSPEQIFLALIGICLFWLLCKISFFILNRKKMIAKPILQDYFSVFLSVLALFFFTVDIYILRLPLLFDYIDIFNFIPTLKAIIFMGLFLVYLFIIWQNVYEQQRKHSQLSISRTEFLISQLYLVIPSLIPWICISIFFDLINLLPFPVITQLLKSPEGSIFLLVLCLLIIAFFSPVIIKLLWKCSPLEPGEARDYIEKICQDEDIEFKDILSWNVFGGAMPTAGIMGIVKRFRYILVTPALIGNLGPYELKSVILHEIGHVKRHHPIFYIFIFSGFLVSSYFLFEPVMLLLYLMEPFYKAFAITGIGKTNAHAVMMVLVMIGTTAIYFRFAFGYLMRHCERQADLYILDASWNPAHLISAFLKIAMITGQSPDRPSWHHFSISERIRFLEKCIVNPKHIFFHHKKVRIIITLFSSILILFSFMGYKISYGDWNNSFLGYIKEKILVQQIKKKPNDKKIQILLADTYYQHKSFQKAITTYKKVLDIESNNPHALNNLAWILLTCPDTSIQNFKKALVLSSKAVINSKQAHIWDTHALALSKNKFHAKAVEASKKALKLNLDVSPGGNTLYFQGQLRKFELILDESLDN